MRSRRQTGLQAMALVAALFFATSVRAQVDQHAIAQQLLGGDQRGRSAALEQARLLGPGNTGAELRAALITVLERNNTIVVEAARRKEPLANLVHPEFVAHVAHVVSQLRDPNAIPALAGALGTGSTLVRDALADFGEQATPDLLRVVMAPDTRKGAVNDALMALRFMVEGAGTPPLSAATRNEIRRAAAQRLTGEQYFTTLWYAIDLAVALNDPDLRRIVQGIAADRNEITARGVSNPDIIEMTQKRAAGRLAGAAPQPRYRSPAERARLLKPG